MGKTALDLQIAYESLQYLPPGSDERDRRIVHAMSRLHTRLNSIPANAVEIIEGLINACQSFREIHTESNGWPCFGCPTCDEAHAAIQLAREAGIGGGKDDS